MDRFYGIRLAELSEQYCRRNQELDLKEELERLEKREKAAWEKSMTEPCQSVYCSGCGEIIAFENIAIFYSDGSHFCIPCADNLSE